ncbi:MAG: YajG family lipoprotein, partial [Planctomycetota bacterium]
MLRTAMSRRRRALWVALTALLAGCAGTSEAVESRPSLDPSSGAGYVKFVSDQEKEIRSGPSAAVVERLGVKVDLRSVLETAFARNPRLLRSRSEWKAAVEKVPQATALPDPTLTVLHYVESVETRVGPMENGFTLAQKIPFPSKLIHAGDVAEEGARI